MRCKKLILMLFLFIPSPVFSQDLTYKKVESISFSLYEKQEWDSLISFAENAYNQGYDYYYLNLRTAIAWFNNNNFYKAEHYFKQALKLDKSSAVANEYLYIIKLILNRPLSADINYKRLPDTVKVRLDKKDPYFVSYVYTEAGVKISSDKSIEANEPLVRLFVGQKLIQRLSLNVSTSYIGQQNAPWGSYNQWEIGLMPSYALGEKINLDLGWRYIHVNRDISLALSENFIDTAEVQTVIGPAIIITDSTEAFDTKSNVLTQVNSFFAGVTFHQNRFTFLARALAYIQQVNLNSIQNFETTYSKTWILTGNDSTIFNDTFGGKVSPTISSNTTSYYYQAMFGGSYTLPFYYNGIIIGFEAYLPISDNFSNAVWIPSLRARIYKSLWFYGEWLQKKQIPLLYQDGNTFLNQSYQLNHRITLGLNIDLNKRFQFYLTYLNESKHYFANNLDNNFNAAIFGINLKL